jgi:1-acyl-sn-glycerol-3-phosphate acyltransferase
VAGTDATAGGGTHVPAGAAPHPGSAVAGASAWLPSAPCTPAACVPARVSWAAAPRAVLRIAALLALLLTGIAAAPLARHVPAGLVRCWCRWLVRAAGVRVRLSGAAAPDGGVLLVANHISWLDIPLLAAVRPARMLAKQEIGDWPVAGPVAARGAVFIDRDRLRALPDTVAHLTSVLRSGAAIAVFPEGSTWCGRAHGSFRRAAFQAALDAGVPVQPVRIRYRRPDGAPSTHPAFVGEDTLVASVWRVATARGLIAEVEVREAIGPGVHPDRRALAAAAERSVLRDTARTPTGVAGHGCCRSPGGSVGAAGRGCAAKGTGPRGAVRSPSLRRARKDRTELVTSPVRRHRPPLRDAD